MSTHRHHLVEWWTPTPAHPWPFLVILTWLIATNQLQGWRNLLGKGLVAWEYNLHHHLCFNFCHLLLVFFQWGTRCHHLKLRLKEPRWKSCVSPTPHTHYSSFQMIFSPLATENLQKDGEYPKTSLEKTSGGLYDLPLRLSICCFREETMVWLKMSTISPLHKKANETKDHSAKMKQLVMSY